LVNARTTELYDRFVTHKVDANSLPTKDFADLIREVVMPFAPKGMVQVHLGGGNTGAEANELALAVALRHYAKTHNVGVGSLCVLGFDNSNHGQTTGTLSCSSVEANPDRLPAFPWPKAEYPQLRYPLAKYEHENRQEEDRCIGVIKSIISNKRSGGQAVGAIIVEPISSINNQMATPYFYKTLRNLAKDEGIPFIVDETKTGMGASGKNWAHEYWYLQDGKGPDFMTFGGKSGLGGFYSTVEHRLNEEATSFQ
jgi:4-aminobutyrate aminotransferase/(S)-3-amino-2-methylpropionate transaminase